MKRLKTLTIENTIFFVLVLVPLYFVLGHIDNGYTSLPDVEVFTLEEPVYLFSTNKIDNYIELIQPKQYTKQDLECLALNMYHEARGEGLSGMLAVSEVVLNRVEDRRFPNGICSVVYQYKQFSWTLYGSKVKSWKEYFEVEAIAKNILEEGIVRQFPKGTVYYINPNKLKTVPSWFKNVTQVAVVGNHHFAK